MTDACRPAADPDSALGSARRAAAPRFLRVGAGSVGGPHGLPVPDRGADRAAARPDRARARGGQGSPRHRGGPRVPLVCGGDPAHPDRARHRRRHPDEDGGRSASTTISPLRTDRSAASPPTATSTGCSSGSITTTCRASRSRRAATGSCSASASATSAATRTGSSNFVEGAAISIGKALFDGVLIFVVSIYMLLDMQRLARTVDRRFPPHTGRPLISRMEHALVSYVRGQITLSLIIGASAGLGLWILGVTGLAARRRLLRAPLRRLGGADRGAALPRPLARRDPARDLRARRAPVLGDLGRAALPRRSTRSRATSSCRR